jgi:hypothetical protein
VAASRSGCTRETEIKGGKVEVDDDGLDVEDGGDELEVDSSVLWARGWWVMCLRSTIACSRSGTRWRRAPRAGSRRQCASRPRTR